MKVVPVIDILDGVVVHAVKGERKKYKPLESKISSSARPLDVAKVFHHLGFGELYVADLNSIMCSGDNFGTIECISKQTRLEVMVDAGVPDIEKARIVMRHGATSLIIGTETMTNIGFIDEAIQALGSNRVIVSLDLKHGKLLSKLKDNKFLDPMTTLATLQKLGVKRVILLDLARVGSKTGVDLPFLREAVKAGKIEVFVGGGVRNMEDLLELDNIGVAGVLLATALHSGTLTANQLAAEGFEL